MTDECHENEGKTHVMGGAVEFDREKCIACKGCVVGCNRVGIDFLELRDEGDREHVDYVCNPGIDCIYCGQCTFICPVDAIHEYRQIDAVEEVLNDPDKVTIVQMAPSTRASIGEAFDQPPGTNVEGKMYTALRQLGFDHVFDINMGADITTYTEAMELAERIKGNGALPMFTSCCPAWVKFVEFYYPEIIPYLTTARSPHMHSGGAYKTWWAEKQGIHPKKIRVISIVPCTSKKYEATLEKFRINGLPPVDLVLTVREAADLLKRHDIDLMKLEDGEADSFGQYSGAAAIYGSSGGVMESALRSAQYFLTGKELDDIVFQDVRGMEGVKKAMVEIAGKKLNVAVANQIKNASLLIKDVRRNPDAYHYIEVMACPGGCVGGGGQPSNHPKVIDERRKALYKIDDKAVVRRAHQNPVVKEFFEEYLAKLPKEEASAIIHTGFRKRGKFE
jgi:iron-only hydrogenase group A